MKFIYLIALLLLSYTTFSQNAVIKGIITTSDGKPAESVTLSLKNTSRGAVANSEGKYEIKNVKPGTYTILTSFIGLITQEKKVTVVAGETVVADFILTENKTELDEVIVSAHKSKTTSEYVAKMPLKNLENPQVYNMVSSDILKQQNITSYDDALKNVPGIFRLWESTGRGGDGGSYFSLRGFESQVTMLNGLPGLTNGNLDPANIEKIEVIKGPSGTLFGSSVISYGGLINNVTKKPYTGFGGEVAYTAGSFGLNRVTADVNTPLTKDNSVLLRVNTAYQSENSFQDYGFKKSFFFAPTISYKVNDRLSFLMVTEFIQQEMAKAPILFLGRNSVLQFKDIKDLNYNIRKSFISNDVITKNPAYNLQAQILYKLSNSWTSQTVVSRGQANTDGYYTGLYDNENGNHDFSQTMIHQNSSTVTADIQQNFTGDFKLGNFRNRIVAGLDYFSRDISQVSTGRAKLYDVTAQGDIKVPQGEKVPYLSTTYIDNLLIPTGNSGYGSRDNIYSTYVSDVFNITPQLMAMASLRVDYFDTKGDPNDDSDDYTQTTLSPKFGLMYQPVKDKVSLFVNYMNGFRNIAPGATYTEQQDGSWLQTGVKTFEPEHANQLEFGIKASLPSNKLNATISYYDIKVTNMVAQSPDGMNSTQGGKTRSKGWEVDITTNPVAGLNILIGYSYNDSKIIKGNKDDIWFDEGRRPFWSGPRNLANAWITYKFLNGAIRGFGIGFGGNYASENLTMNSATQGVFALPEYTIINGSLFYDANKFRIGFNLNNIGNKEYFSGGWSTVNPQKPRNFAASIAYKF